MQIVRERKLQAIYPSSTVRISEIQILFVRGKTYEGSQCANQATGGDKEDEVRVMPLCQQLAANMPGKLRHTWTWTSHPIACKGFGLVQESDGKPEA